MVRDGMLMMAFGTCIVPSKTQNTKIKELILKERFSQIGFRFQVLQAKSQKVYLHRAQATPRKENETAHRHVRRPTHCRPSEPRKL